MPDHEPTHHEDSRYQWITCSCGWTSTHFLLRYGRHQSTSAWFAHCTPEVSP